MIRDRASTDVDGDVPRTTDGADRGSSGETIRPATDRPLDDRTKPNGTPGAGPAGKSPTPWYKYVAVGFAFGAFLAILFYAEIAWLHKGIPQDRASRVTLVVFPKEGAPGDQANVSTDALVELATSESVLRELIDSLDLREGSSGQPLSPGALADRMHVRAQCITSDGDRGVLIANVVRGADDQEVERIARAWSDLIVLRAATELPGLEVQPAGTTGRTYDVCR